MIEQRECEFIAHFETEEKQAGVAFGEIGEHFRDERGGPITIMSLAIVSPSSFSQAAMR